MKYMVSDRICAGIVTYNPEIYLLKRSINSLKSQIKTIVVIDNASNNLKEIKALCSNYTNVEIIVNLTNRGIATALNQIGDYAKLYKYDWFLTLDQDSVCPNNLIETYSHYLSYNKVALICPYILQRIHLDKIIVPQKEYEYIQIAITSGSLVRTVSWIDVGGFWDDLFIDRVDDDFCFALRDKGWEILQTNSVKLEHQIGNPKLHSFFLKKYYTDSYSSFRYYFISRNTIVVCNYYHNLPYNMYKLLFKRFFKILIGENRKYDKMCAFFKGIVDGRKMVKEGLSRNRI